MFLLCVVLLMVFAVYVWPTRYRYHVTSFAGSQITIRENRFTGKVNLLMPYGWQ